MLKTLLKQLILEECIDTLFNNIKHNFTPLNEELIVTTKILEENDSYIRLIYFITFTQNKKTYKFKQHSHYIHFKTEDYINFNLLIKNYILTQSNIRNISVLQFLTQKMLPC